MHGDIEYCGDCVVCDDPVDLSDMGACKSCGGAFHWGQCGEWHGNEHTCSNCMPDDEEE
ncbi:TPA: hypothetical protein NJ322_004343 [Vibrio parahaemolyticus]|nr:hypothetical protein [Vibrio parahaemolyticus]HCG7105042.1 hypothetical protein [Vibrio parahaemolyticus]